jgi:hypothetical protein
VHEDCRGASYAEDVTKLEALAALREHVDARDV